MPLVLQILAVLALIGLTGAVVLALWPVVIAAHGFIDADDLRVRLDVSWLGLGVRASTQDGLSVRVLGLRIWRMKHPPTGREDKEPKQPRHKRSRWRPTVRFLIRVLRRSVRSIRVRARLAGCVGLGDPADTAWLFLLVRTVHGAWPRADLRELHVDWTRPVLELDGVVRGFIWPVALAWIVGTELLRERLRRRTPSRAISAVGAEARG